MMGLLKTILSLGVHMYTSTPHTQFKVDLITNVYPHTSMWAVHFQSTVFEISIKIVLSVCARMYVDIHIDMVCA